MTRRSARASRTRRRPKAYLVRVAKVETQIKFEYSQKNQVRAHLEIQEQSREKSMPRAHTDSIFDDPCMLGKIT
jgi:hypothetical protein